MLNKYKSIFMSEFISFAASAVAILLIPFVGMMPDGIGGVLSNIVAVIFWLGILAGILFSVLAGRIKAAAAKITRGKLRIKQKLPGIINFNLRRDSIIVYLIFIVGLILIICDTALSCINQYVMFPVIALTMLAFFTHCIIDGKNYKIYKLLK